MGEYRNETLGEMDHRSPLDDEMADVFGRGEEYAVDTEPDTETYDVEVDPTRGGPVSL